MVGGSSIGSSHAIAHIDAILIHCCIFTPVRESAVVWGREGGGSPMHVGVKVRSQACD